MKDLKLTIVTASATALVAFFGIKDAAAQAAAEPKQQIVSFADLDLSGPAGAQTLYNRVRSAARRVCSDLDGRPLDQQQRYRACMAQATANAVTSIDEPTLTDVYLAQSGRTQQRAQHVARTR